MYRKLSTLKCKTSIYKFLIREIWKGYRANLAGLTKKRIESKFIIGYIYKFEIFKLSSILFFYIY